MVLSVATFHWGINTLAHNVEGTLMVVARAAETESKRSPCHGGPIKYGLKRDGHPWFNGVHNGSSEHVPSGK